jgi:hypothetical protein
MSQSKQQSSEGGLVQFEGFSGLNTQASRYGIEDTQCYIMDGFFPMGKSNARIIPDHGPAGFTAPDGLTIGFFDFANIGNVYISLIFLSDGSVWQLTTDTLMSRQIAPPATFSGATPSTTALTQWGDQFVLIVTNVIPNGYFIWDGTTFWVPGSEAGFGTLPTGINGNVIASYGSHVWVGNGPNMVFSAPQSITDFSTADGGGSFTSNDSTLREAYTWLVNSNGYLYLGGDSSISYIAGVQTTTSDDVTTTTFSLQNVDPEVGTPWNDVVEVLDSNICFANPWGVHVAYGGRAAKVSNDLNGIYNSVSGFGGYVPSSGKAILFGKRVYVLLLWIVDQVTMQPTNKLFLWDEKEWCTTSQSLSLTFIRGQEQLSNLTAWGTDGTSLYRLFQSPGTVLTKTIQSKMWAPLKSYVDIKAENRIWALYQYFSGVSALLSVSVDSEFGSSYNNVTIVSPIVIWLNNSDDAVVWTNSSSETVEWESNTPGIQVIPPAACGQQGALCGITVQTTASDIALISVATMPVDVQYRG